MLYEQIPCRTAMRGSFPLNGTYFQVNEVSIVKKNKKKFNNSYSICIPKHKINSIIE